MRTYFVKPSQDGFATFYLKGFLKPIHLLLFQLLFLFRFRESEITTIHIYISSI
ncbi:hypothetical protein DDD_2170 [Nonlabens dokdonensis DSW-6]|uniref:Uncharacterized protein n=1 Tax=Nonlabens dokdonensis (strain DSM 17205 / KCTC 12402 / DSW-6) TaxID=592029 RepID=L7WAV1_NONDD|nr:hypothetical protein DDD_2170 [Nonlabens dokdonensis DSW-6]